MADSRSTQGRTKTPPADLNERELPIIQYSGPLHRIHRSEHGPIYFGRKACYRFDDPAGERGLFGTLYAATDELGAFIETYGDSEGNTVSRQGLSKKSISVLRLEKEINLVDLTSAGRAWIGGAGEITAGNYDISQQWASALFQHPEQPDGIFYRARHDQSKFSIALYHPQEALLSIEQSFNLMDKKFEHQLGNILNNYRFAIL